MTATLAPTFRDRVETAFASVVGPRHIKLGQPNQDAVGIIQLPGLISITVSDGVGSASRSDEGSRLAVQEGALGVAFSLQRYASDLDPRIFNDLQDLWCSALPEPDSKNFAATILFLGLTPGLLVAGQLGDGVVLGVRRDGTVERLVEPRSRAWCNTVQPLSERRLAPEDVACTVTLRPRPEETYSAFILATDGVADDVADEALFAGDLQRQLRALPGRLHNAALEELLVHWPTRQHQDDKTIACVLMGGDQHVDAR